MTVENRYFANSTNVESAVYDGDAQELTVEFRSGHSYTSGEPVPEAVWEAFKSAPSPGRFFHANLKGRYGFP